jgi:hypothetical protein
MLSSVDHILAPAAAICRRRFRTPLQVPVMLVLAVGAGCAAPGPDPITWDGTRAALRRAVDELRPVDPQAAEEIERLVASAERATAVERAAPPWRREPGSGAAAWLKATESARRNLKEVRALRASQAERLGQLLERAEQRIAAASRRIGRSGMSGRDAGQVAAGRTHVATARRLAAQGDYSAAIDHAADALTLAAELDASWNRNHVRFSDPSLLAMWRGQAEAAINESRRTKSAAIVIDKLRRKVSLYKSGHRVAQFDAELGSNGLERKRYSGDRATPEGRYRITAKKSRAVDRVDLYRHPIGGGEIASHVVAVDERAVADHRHRQAEPAQLREQETEAGIQSRLPVRHDRHVDDGKALTAALVEAAPHRVRDALRREVGGPRHRQVGRAAELAVGAGVAAVLGRDVVHAEALPEAARRHRPECERGLTVGAHAAALTFPGPRGATARTSASNSSIALQPVVPSHSSTPRV